EALFRDALRVGQVVALAPKDPTALDEAMRSFDRAAALILCLDELDGEEGSLSTDLLEQGRAALSLRDTGLLLGAAESIRTDSSTRGLPAPAVCGALVCAAIS